MLVHSSGTRLQYSFSMFSLFMRGITVRNVCVLGDFLLLKKMDQRICIKFCVKNEIKCSKILELLTVAYVFGVKKMFISGTNLRSPGEPRPKKAFQVRSNVKVLLTVFFVYRGRGASGVLTIWSYGQ